MHMALRPFQGDKLICWGIHIFPKWMNLEVTSLEEFHGVFLLLTRPPGSDVYFHIDSVSPLSIQSGKKLRRFGRTKPTCRQPFKGDQCHLLTSSCFLSAP